MAQGLPGRVARYGYGALLIAIGAILLIGGGLLLSLGGSLYYAVAGLATIGSGVFVWRGDRRGAILYAAMVVGTIAWAIWEVGFDGWQLTARVVAPLVLGIGFAFTAIRGSAPASASRGRSFAMLGIALVASVGLGALAHQFGPAAYPDPLYQTGMGTLAPEVANAPDPLSATGTDWQNYGNDLGGSRHTPLSQITPANVDKLQVAWEVHVGGMPRSLEVTPIKIGDSLYACTANNDVLSIDAESGRVNWRFRSGISLTGRPSANCRGVGYFRVPNATGDCAERIYTNTVDARLIALSAATGRPCAGFGKDGIVDLTAGMGPVDIGYYYVSSAPTVVRGKIVLGGWVSDGQHWGEPSGVIRAFDATTGTLAWAFDMGRPDRTGAPADGETYTRSTPNSWAPMSADPALGLVFAPIGNATPDYYGVQRRPFDDQYSSAVVALDVDTGKPRWTFQTTHHDLWDYDVASQPTLVDIPTPNGLQRALVQPTKRGEIFLLDRVTGKPLADVVERAVPQTGGPAGERYAPTQPFSVGMPSFGGPRWQERDMWGLTPLDQMWCRVRFRQARYDGTMTPLGETPSITYPGYLGGVDWGSATVDPVRGLLIVNSNRVGNYNQLVPRGTADAMGVKPSKGGSPRALDGIVAQGGTPYAAKIKPFLSPLGAPCNAPPYGLISAVDLRTHKLIWSRPLGTARDSGPLGIPSGLPFTMGTPNAGGAMTTRSGLIFIAATQERTFRAIDTRTGRELWSTRLPAGGQASPMSYQSRSGRQFVVLATGGNLGLQSKLGDSIIAYALPTTR